VLAALPVLIVFLAFSFKARVSAIETARAEARAAQTKRRSNRLSGAAEAAQEGGADLIGAATEASLQEDEDEEVKRERARTVVLASAAHTDPTSLLTVHLC
jgi:hypothetical protein